jgi:lipid-A-disaccharide synthase
LRIFLSAGEVSGDIVGALLSRKIREIEPEVEISGVGGARMAAAGVTIDARTSHLGTVGVTEAVRAVPAFARVLAAIRRRVRAGRPDVAICIGNDVFNVLLARWLRGRGVATVSYFPPQVWIWRAVARVIAGSYDLILTSFPLEQEVYARAGARTASSVEFVGHYLCDSLRPRTADDIAASRSRVGVEGASPVLALLPGSRPHEVRRLAGVLLDSAREMSRSCDRLRIVVPVADAAYRDRIEAEVQARDLGERVRLIADSHEAMRSADVVILASGTASLEAALLGVPMVIVYRVSSLTLGIIRAIIRLGLIESETVGLPNLILGSRVVPELGQKRASVDGIVHVTRSLLEDETKRHAMRSQLLRIAGKLAAGDTLARVAAATLECGHASLRGQADGSRVEAAAALPRVTDGRS